MDTWKPVHKALRILRRAERAGDEKAAELALDQFSSHLRAHIDYTIKVRLAAKDKAERGF